jgi:hypothetical protein
MEMNVRKKRAGFISLAPWQSIEGLHERQALLDGKYYAVRRTRGMVGQRRLLVSTLSCTTLLGI